jgi:type IV secretion system protein VirD4
VVAGSFVSVAVFFVFANRRARRLSEGAEDIHGSASWASGQDVRETGLLSSTHGVYVGGWSRGGNGHVSYLRHNGPEHVVAFAPTRSGKGLGLVIPTLLTWEESAIVYDIKGENWAKTAGFSQAMRTPVLQVFRQSNWPQAPDSILWPKFACLRRTT